MVVETYTQTFLLTETYRFDRFRATKVVGGQTVLTGLIQTLWPDIDWVLFDECARDLLDTTAYWIFAVKLLLEVIDDDYFE